jgi:ubiquinone/menaquinone biosynthesis C-methylase UbiE
MLSMTDQEQLTALVFGDTFALYDERSFDEFITPLRDRLRANGIEASVFSGKRCLDAGCGGGRGSILMAQSGAREVVGVDLSETNVRTCRMRAAQKGLTNLTFQQHSLADLPFEDETFDLVWCNGVLHHITEPDRGLGEIARVLKRGGRMWLYLYGSGGIYWYVVDWMRTLARGLDVRDCIAQLRLMDVPVRRIAEWMDDWFTAYLRRYTRDDVVRRLDELGFVDTVPLDRGMRYDTSERRLGASDRERQLMGDGDIRHFCQKAAPAADHGAKLPDPPDGKGSPYEDGPAVTQFAAPLARISEAIAALEASRGHAVAAYELLVCRSVHSKVRELLESDRPFDESALHHHLTALQGLLGQLVRS